ncbi:Helix-turn-helix domain-containing protein [Sphingomonas laterariae]|uniref:Helix-turn-helix domain-containing protein n=1 Tax=Edaphosphingomonas laterariae TaxID=861865 RepID=A0A239GFJ4_9SPHN|nr:helix-turn-helix domain-containing protein [Sphingomonas laterariae]SNS67512.1 Helix-turn-helix domain-containing protein [Sphingomonas laterariae]
MSQTDELIAADFSGFRLVKQISGERIREERRRRQIKQVELADAIGVSLRWLREIEAGNQGARLDDHLAATIRLGLPASNIVLPVLFMAQRMPVPRLLLHTDLEAVERACVDLVAESTIRLVTEEMRPGWWDVK